MSEAPIGIFDSGLGGLTVFQAISQLLPQEELIYLGDTAHVPYGDKTEAAIRRYTTTCANFLMSKGIKALVVACNSATVAALTTLQESLPIPVMGVVSPGVEAALDRTRNGRIGVIGTRRTIESRAYERSLATRDATLFIKSIATPLLVPLVEEQFWNHLATRLIMNDYLAPLIEAQIDTLLLGCTHYPLLTSVFQDLMGTDVAIVDSASACARELSYLLRDKHLLNSNSVKTPASFYVSDNPRHFQRLAENFLQTPPIRIEVVAPASMPVMIEGLSPPQT